MGLGRTTSNQNGGSEIRRKPSPIWMGDDTTSGMGEMVQTVGDVWGMEREVLEKDVASIRQAGSLDSLYLAELKAALTTLSALPPPLSPTQRARQAQLAEALQNVLNDFPDLATPGSPNGYVPSSDAQGAVFTPPRKVDVLGRLTARASEVGLGLRTRDVVERCREIWGIASRRDRERELESVIKRWGDSIGTREEASWGASVVEGVRDVSAGQRPTDPLSPHPGKSTHKPLIPPLYLGILHLPFHSLTSTTTTSFAHPNPQSRRCIPRFDATILQYMFKPRG